MKQSKQKRIERKVESNQQLSQAEVKSLLLVNQENVELHAKVEDLETKALAFGKLKTLNKELQETVKSMNLKLVDLDAELARNKKIVSKIRNLVLTEDPSSQPPSSK